MSQHYRRLKEEQIMQRELSKKRSVTPKEETKAVKPMSKADIKMAFFKDIFSKSFPHDAYIWNRIQARKAALVKYGYWTKEGEITELGYDRLSAYLLKKETNTS